MHWRLSEASAIGVVGASQIEVVPSAPARGAHWQIKTTQAEQPTVAGEPEAGKPVAWQLAAVRPILAHSSQPHEVYSRQSDLIVRYGQGPSEQFSYQLDWRLLQPAAPFAAAVELWLSIQTDLLDTQPELEIACTAPPGLSWSTFEHRQLIPTTASPAPGVPAPEVSAAAKAMATESSESADSQRGPAALLCSAAAGADRAAVQGLWLIEPTDQRHARRCSADEQAEQRVRLFGHFMEKGVIRRARMRFLLAAALDSHAMITHEQVIAAYRDFADSPLPLTA